MSFKHAIVLGLVAVAACAGCATGTGSAGLGSTVTSGAGSQAFPIDVGRDIERCSSGGVYNRAAGFCVSNGP